MCLDIEDGTLTTKYKSYTDYCSSFPTMIDNDLGFLKSHPLENFIIREEG